MPVAAIAVAAACLGLAGPAAAKGGPEASSSIVNGRKAMPGQFPWMAYVSARLGKHSGFACSGTVVSPYVVLTAGHCVESPETGLVTRGEAYTVVIGRTDLTDKTSGEKLKVARAVVSPRFSPFGTLRGDLGLLILDKPTTAPPVPIAHAGDAALSAAGAAATVAGWGLTSGSAEQTPKVLRWGTTTLGSSAFCRKHVSLPPARYSTSTQLCTFEAGAAVTTPCHGDSGGPLLGQAPGGAPVQIGIVSYGDGACRHKGADVYTRVDRFAAWIDAWIAAATPGSGLPKPETGAAQGPILPVLGGAEAEEAWLEALRQAFGPTFKNHRKIIEDCVRFEASVFGCFVAWLHRGSVFLGTGRVYLTFEGQAVVPASHYTISRYRTRCVENRGPSGFNRCRKVVRRG